MIFICVLRRQFNHELIEFNLQPKLQYQNRKKKLH